MLSLKPRLASLKERAHPPRPSRTLHRLRRSRKLNQCYENEMTAPGRKEERERRDTSGEKARHSSIYSCPNLTKVCLLERNNRCYTATLFISQRKRWRMHEVKKSKSAPSTQSVQHPLHLPSVCFIHDQRESEERREGRKDDEEWKREKEV